MPELLTLKSKVELGCDRCDTCCKYRGDIRLTIKNIPHKKATENFFTINLPFFYYYIIQANNCQLIA